MFVLMMGYFPVLNICLRFNISWLLIITTLDQLSFIDFLSTWKHTKLLVNTFRCILKHLFWNWYILVTFFLKKWVGLYENVFKWIDSWEINFESIYFSTICMGGIAQPYQQLSWQSTIKTVGFLLLSFTMCPTVTR